MKDHTGITYDPATWTTERLTQAKQMAETNINNNSGGLSDRIREMCNNDPYGVLCLPYTMVYNDMEPGDLAVAVDAVGLNALTGLPPTTA